MAVGVIANLEDTMRGPLTLLALTLTAPGLLMGQRPDVERPRTERRDAGPELERHRDIDPPSYSYRYGRDDDDDAIREYRRWVPRIRCDYRDRGCERRVEAMQREEARWRRDARERSADFEREMAERERKFRAKELERWRKRREEMIRRWGDLMR